MKRKFLAMAVVAALASTVAAAQSSGTQSPQQNMPGQTAQSETQNNTAGSISGNAKPMNTAPGTPDPATPQGQAGQDANQRSTAPPMPGQAGVNSQNTGAQSSTASDVSLGSTVVNSAALQDQVNSAFQSEPTLAGANVKATVTDATIELTGTVPTAKEKTTATRIAKSYAENRKVVDKLTVGGAGGSSTMNPAMSTTGQSPGVVPANPAQTPKGSKPKGDATPIPQRQ